MIFAREITGPLTSLVKEIDAVNQKQGKKMGSFVVFLSDKEGLKDELKKLAEKENLKHTILAIDNPAGPRGYDIAKEAAVTVVLYKKKKVQANHAFRKGELNAKAVESILEDDMPKIISKK